MSSWHVSSIVIYHNVSVRDIRILHVQIPFYMELPESFITLPMQLLLLLVLKLSRQMLALAGLWKCDAVCAYTDSYTDVRRRLCLCWGSATGVYSPPPPRSTSCPSTITKCHGGNGGLNNWIFWQLYLGPGEALAPSSSQNSLPIKPIANS